MRYIYVLVVFSLIFSSLKAQTVIVNQDIYGGNSNEFLFDSDTLLNGTVVISGSSSSNISGNKTTVNYGLGDGWLLNINQDLSVNWEINIGGTDDDLLNVIYPTSDGGFLCGGTSRSPVSGNKTATNIGGDDFWLLKIDVNGSVLWEKTYGGFENDQLNSISKLDNGDFILTGSSKSNISGDKTENSRGSYDYWIIRIDNNGSIIWDKTIGGNASDILSGSVFFDQNQNIYLNGKSSSNISNEKTENSYGLSDLWLVKIDENGNVIWDKTIGGSSLEFAYDILGFDNSIFILASSSSPLSGNKTSIQIGFSDYWLVNVSVSGDIIWDKTFGGLAVDYPMSIAVISDDRLLLSGGTSSSESQDVVGVNNGDRDCWFFSVNKNGDLIEEKNIGGDQFDMIKSIINLQDGKLLLLGESQSGISGDKTSLSYGARDLWVFEISTTMGVKDDNIFVSNNTKLHPNPNNGNFTILGDLIGSEITIYNINGQIVEKFKSKNITITINLLDKNLEAGIYFMTVQSDKSIESIKFVIE